MDPKLERFALRQIEMATFSALKDKTKPVNEGRMDVLVAAAIAHQCVPFFTQYLQNENIEIPKNLRTWNRDASARNLLYTYILKQVAVEFDIPWLVLKGIPLAESLFGDLKWRQSTDLDLLILWEDLDSALMLLQKMGFVLERKIRPWAYNQIALRHQKHHATIELHWRLSLPYLPAPSTKSLLNNARYFDSTHLGIPVPTLNNDATFFNLIMHFHQHYAFIKGGIDLAAWMSHSPLEEGLSFCKSHGILKLANIAIATTAIRGFTLPRFPELSRTERGFLDKRVSIQNAFENEEDSKSASYFKFIQNALFLDSDEQRVQGLEKSVLWGPHRFSDYLQNFVRQ